MNQWKPDPDQSWLLAALALLAAIALVAGYFPHP